MLYISKEIVNKKFNEKQFATLVELKIQKLIEHESETYYIINDHVVENSRILRGLCSVARTLNIKRKSGKGCINCCKLRNEKLNIKICSLVQEGMNAI